MLNLPSKPTAMHEEKTRVFQPEPVQKESPGRRLLRALALLFALVAFAVAGGIFAVVLIFGWQWRAEGRILPGIHAAGVQLNGLSESEAAQMLAASWAARRIELTAAAGVIEATPAELGIELDAAATAAQAAGWSRRTDLWRSVEFIMAGGEVPPVWTFDQGQAAAFLTGLAPQFEVTPANAGLLFENGRLIETPPLPGKRLDVDGTLAGLDSKTADLLYGGRLPLVISEVPPQITSTAGLIARYNDRLTADLTVPLFDPISGHHASASLPAAVWTGWLTAVPAGEEEIDFEVNTGAILPYVQQVNGALPNGQFVNPDDAPRFLHDLIAAQIDQTAGTPGSLRVYHAERQHVVQSGETLSSIARDYGFPYPWLQQANPDSDTLFPGQTLTIPSPDVLLPLPVVENKRLVISLSQQKLWAYENDALLWEWTISTGIDSSPTSPGVFQVQSHEEEAYAGNWDLWMPLFIGIYRPVPTSDFMNGFHGFPTRDGYQLLWTNSLGTRVTYGCILVGDQQINDLYQWAEEGTVVEVQS